MFVSVSQVVWSCQTWNHSQHMSQARAAGGFALVMRFLCSQMACGCVQISLHGLCWKQSSLHRLLITNNDSWAKCLCRILYLSNWQFLLGQAFGSWHLHLVLCHQRFAPLPGPMPLVFVHIAWIDELPLLSTRASLWGCSESQVVTWKDQNLQIFSIRIRTQFMRFMTSMYFNVLRISTKDQRFLPGSATGWLVVNMILMIMYPSFKVAQIFGFTLTWFQTKNMFTEEFFMSLWRGVVKRAATCPKRIWVNRRVYSSRDVLKRHWNWCDFLTQWYQWLWHWSQAKKKNKYVFFFYGKNMKNIWIAFLVIYDFFMIYLWILYDFWDFLYFSLIFRRNFWKSLIFHWFSSSFSWNPWFFEWFESIFLNFP